MDGGKDSLKIHPGLNTGPTKSHSTSRLIFSTADTMGQPPPKKHHVGR